MGISSVYVQHLDCFSKLQSWGLVSTPFISMVTVGCGARQLDRHLVDQSVLGGGVVYHLPVHHHHHGLVGVLLHLGAELQLGQQRPQDLDPPLHGEHRVWPVVGLHDFPHLNGVVRPVGAGAVVVSPRLVLLVHGVHLGAEHQLGQWLP